VFTFIARKIHIFYLHSSQKCITFALDLRQRQTSATYAIKPLNHTMKVNVITMKQQTQDFLLRLFVDSSGDSTPSDTFYTCAHCGTFSRTRR
jgi:hypothetical protein